jgi:hypothetical protein
MTRRHSNQDGYSLQPLADVTRAVVQNSPETWADSMHTQWSQGFFSRQFPADVGLKLRAMFKAIRMLQAGDDRQQKKAAQMSRFLETEWGLKQACAAIGGQNLDKVRELRDAWGDVQLPPIDAFADGIAADEALIAAVIRRLR